MDNRAVKKMNCLEKCLKTPCLSNLQNEPMWLEIFEANHSSVLKKPQSNTILLLTLN